MDPLAEPSISRPQSRIGRMAAGTGQVPASRVHLGRHRQQRPGQRAQHARFGYARTRFLPRTARRRAPRLLHVRCRLVRAVLGRQGTALFGRDLVFFTLRMVGVPVQDPLRMVEVAGMSALRMGAAHLLALRMTGVFWDW